MEFQHCLMQWTGLTLNTLKWKIWWAPNNASRWQMGLNSAFKELILLGYIPLRDLVNTVMECRLS